jgi:hypothetical protein
MTTASKVGRAPLINFDRAGKPVSAGSPLTTELKGFIDRVIVPILVRDYLSGIAREKQLAHPREGVASCESTVMPNAESAR